MASKKVAVVTGSNKGVGLSIVRALCKQFDGDVILTSRDVGRGQAAVKQLQQEGLKPEFQQLDVLDSASIRALRDFLNNKYGGLDVLVNNAGMLFADDAKEPFAEQAAVTIKTNFTAVVDICNELFPLLRPHARVVNMSSMMSGMFYRSCSKALQDTIKDPNITMDTVTKLMEGFVSAAQKGTLKQEGWPAHAYAVSKIGIRMLSYVQQQQFNSDSRQGIIVNSCCPGFVASDMTSHMQSSAKITPEQGAVTPTYLCLLPPNVESPRGEYVTEMKIQRWG